MNIARLRNYLLIPAFLTLTIFNWGCGVDQGEKLALDFEGPVSISFTENGVANPTELPVTGQVEIRLKNTLENSGGLNLNSYMYKTQAYISTSADGEFQIIPEASVNSVYGKVSQSFPNLTSTEKELQSADFIDSYREHVHEDGKYKMILGNKGEYSLAMAPITLHGTLSTAAKINVDGSTEEITLANIEELARIQATASSNEENGELTIVINAPAVDNDDVGDFSTLPGGPSTPQNTGEAGLPASGGCSLSPAQGLSQAWFLILGLVPLFHARLRKK